MSDQYPQQHPDPNPYYPPQPPPQQPTPPPQYGYYPPQPPPEPRNGYGITALILAIVGCVFMLIPLTGFIATICGLLAILFALLNRGRLKRRTATNKKMTIVAAILGLLSTVVGIIGMVIVFSAVDDLDDDLTCLDKAKTVKQMDRCN